MSAAWRGREIALPTIEGWTRSFRAFFNKGLVVLATLPAVYLNPTLLTVILKACDIGAEERRKFTTASRTLAFVTHLVIQDIRLDLHPLVDVVVLQLDESSADGRNVALLIRESDTPCPFRVL